MRIIPAIDIIEGKCVRLTQGDYSSKKVYNQNPLEVAKEFEDNGVEYLHLVDLDGAKMGEIVNYKVLEQIATKTSLRIDYGGGLKTNEDLHIAFNSGAKQVTGGSVAVKNPKMFEGWVQKYGSHKIILGADTSEGKIAISGWQETSEEDLVPFIKTYMKKDLRYVICTDISKDGMLEGPSIDLYKKVLEECSYSSTDQSIRLIASGGISSMDDLYKLKEIGCEGAIIGKALYENKIDLRDLSRLL